MIQQLNQRQMAMCCWYLGDTALTYLPRGSEKCTWNSPNPILAEAITFIKRVGGGERKLLAVRFIDRKQALCDKNLKLRASKFAILNHQIGSYKFTGFLIGCRHSRVYQCSTCIRCHLTRRPEFCVWQWVFVFMSMSGFVFFYTGVLTTHLRLQLLYISVWLCLFSCVHVSGCIRSCVCGPAVNGPLHFPSIAVKEGNDL